VSSCNIALSVAVKYFGISLEKTFYRKVIFSKCYFSDAELKDSNRGKNIDEGCL
jgi:hypothetical protein